MAAIAALLVVVLKAVVVMLILIFLFMEMLVWALSQAAQAGLAFGPEEQEGAVTVAA